jgi:hypothetical protein
VKEIGSMLNEPKNAALLGAECELPADFPIRRGVIYDGPTGKTGNLFGLGLCARDCVRGRSQAGDRRPTSVQSHCSRSCEKKTTRS